MHPDDNPDARRAPTPSGRPPAGPPRTGPNGPFTQPGPPGQRPPAPGPGQDPRRPLGPNTGGGPRPPAHGGPGSGRFSQPAPAGPRGPDRRRPTSGFEPRQSPPPPPPTRAHPPEVLSGPAANSNAAYSLQRPTPDYGRPDPTSRTAPPQTSDDPHLHDDSESSDMTAAPRNSTNVLAIVALVLSFLGLTSIFGIVCGHVARRQIRANREQGDSLAVAALWIGYFYLGAAILCLVVYFFIAGQGS